ncbi:bifunctional UDP-N-acetylmuramoyl-tripeptide:D-alanyl-D-alanine ligase/alanine racemase [Dysgonomonas sp. 25]|uniref:bifunctional UDP-N-acetylmuramoyl-tripeptide:D-alanyl-D-alanine ligase/alanine racemase n=1 Tax=Dysgonomonas sp. 25 TaxID=2302933 RepID=UPI0013D782DF|nr:bifunctional UDP-N-acetylmuramoyl-tripeptide:D-alanyl-D-alanine ligase/alanine racemase [Dysgonomonas sp. 25]NDV69364.1 bifunctional UDP-N-acetylmuramoyl-tripeptide:D-alanyl-D-alanine ligase/alanine racemase [Dysgonomonas sp. 25]
MKYKIEEITKALGLKGLEPKDATISILLTDSRNLFSPAETLFFALVTKNNDGHKYVTELYHSKVRNFVVSKMLPEWESFDDANFLVVPDTLKALQRVATYHRNRFDIPVIGITGSNGKTVVKEWLYQVLAPNFHITHSPRSYNSQVGVPLSVWQMDEYTELGIFEAGISQVEEMSSLQPIIKPNIGIFTNIGQAHQEGFESMKQKCLEKLELFINCDVIICEEENELLEECMQIACLSHKRITWSRKAAHESPVKIYKIKREKNATLVKMTLLDFKVIMEIPFVDEASFENVMHIVTAAVYMHIPIEALIERVRQLTPIAMRLDVRPGKNGCILINDSYNTDINSLNIALGFLEQRATNSELKKILILSDIPQSGIDNHNLYTIAADLVRQKGIDTLIAIGSEIGQQKELFTHLHAEFYPSTESFVHSCRWMNLRDAVVLLKGARNFSFEQINRLLEVKTHETVFEVDLDAIVHNFNFYRSHLKPDTKIICMVKADAYGTGASEVAKTLQYHKCDYLAVAVAEEGVILRKEGISMPIIVLNPEVGGFEELVTYSLEPEVYNFRILEAYIKEARAQGVSNYPIHLKIDTGMHRLGFTQEDIPHLIDLLCTQVGVSVRSVFSHLAASESWQFDDFTTQQISTFKKISKELSDNLPYPVMHHILNSAGIERFPEEQMDMVRLGISLYGVSASGLDRLQNVCTLKTTILQIKHIPAGETVGYGRKGKIEKDSTIATIRIGYADGLSRRFGNGVGEVVVNGQKAPIVGNICMDLTMIDITGIEAKEGDSVVIFGKEQPVTTLAEKIETIPYEILTAVSRRVKRIFFKE